MRETIKEKPPSGTILMYDKTKVPYRKDKYDWQKRKGDVAIREDHMKLKVGGIEVSSRNAHSS